MKPAKLSDAHVAQRLSTLPGWKRDGNSIQRTFELPTFAAAVAFVNQVATVAEAANHHPDILVQYEKVTLTLSTHDAGGLTKLDFDFAARLERA